MPRDYGLHGLYVNIRRLAELLGPSAFQQTFASHGFSSFSEDRYSEGLRVAHASSLLKQWLLTNVDTVLSFEQLLITNSLELGSIFTTHRDFYCRNVHGRAKKGGRSPLMYARYDLGDVETKRLVLNLHPDHVVPGSAGDLLHGRVANLFVVAMINDMQRDAVYASPVYIGQMSIGTSVLFAAGGYTEVHVETIDNFALCRHERIPTLAELTELRSIAERDVKKAFASLLLDDAIPNDWAGETSDYFTSMLRIDGRRLSAAFLFKGPAKFHKMTLADLGKNGDQIVRLYNEPADLFVVQHCHLISTPVRMFARAFANQAGNLRHYCVVDGRDTLRILRAYGQCGFSPSATS